MSMNLLRSVTVAVALYSINILVRIHVYSSFDSIFYLAGRVSRWLCRRYRYDAEPCKRQFSGSMVRCLRLPFCSPCRTSPRFVPNLYHLTSCRCRYGLPVIFEFVNKCDSSKPPHQGLHCNGVAICTYTELTWCLLHTFNVSARDAFSIMEELECHFGIRSTLNNPNELSHNLHDDIENAFVEMCEGAALPFCLLCAVYLILLMLNADAKKWMCGEAIQFAILFLLVNFFFELTGFERSQSVAKLSYKILFDLQMCDSREYWTRNRRRNATSFR